jgi:glycerol-3-phosphate dehydrogenase (NAD(P)+)
MTHLDHGLIRRIGVLGAGSWGTALAMHLARKGYEVALWSHGADLVPLINERHQNPTYLPGFVLPENLTASNDIAEVVSGKDLILLVPPSHVLREVMLQARDHLPHNVPIVSATKGIENDSLLLVHEILEEVLPVHHHPYLAYLSGPSFAREVADGQPTLVVIASHWPRLAQTAQAVFHSDTFRCYTSHDVIGVECGGALKNVIAIGAGAVTGLGFGHNTMTAYLTRGLAEITRLAVRKGANPLTLSGLAGMGDLVLTCTGSLSRNRAVGLKLAQGMTRAQILGEMNMVAEGIRTSKSVYDLSRKLGVETPICEQVYLALYEDLPVVNAIQNLLTRTPKQEMVFHQD